MTENKKIKTDYSELDKILEELGIIEYIKYGERLPTEWHELKTLRVEDGIQALSPVSVDDIMKLYKKVKSTLCNNLTCNGRENGIRVRQAEVIIRNLLEVYENGLSYDYKEKGRVAIMQAKQFIGE